MDFKMLLVLISSVILTTSALPQYNIANKFGSNVKNGPGGYDGPNEISRPRTPGFSRARPRPGGYDGPGPGPVPISPSFNAPGAAAGGVGTACASREVAPGHWKFTCDNVVAPVIQTEHVLWIDLEHGPPQWVDIEVPNYKLDQYLKAGFKGSFGQNTQVNVLLKRPVHDYNAAVDRPPTKTIPPAVNVNYEPVEKLLVHYPNDKPYSQLSGPILERDN